MSKPTSKETKAIMKTLTNEQVDMFLKKGLAIQGDETSLIKKMAEVLLPALKAGDKSDESYKAVTDTGFELMKMRESEYHCNLMESFPERYRQLSKLMTEKIISEHNCQNEIEKSLASTIVASYVRYTDNSRRLNNELEGTNITPNKNTYISILSKQVDRAHRQYLTSLMTLKQLKAPQIEMNIKANTAFVSQNQQFNHHEKINETK